MCAKAMISATLAEPAPPRGRLIIASAHNPADLPGECAQPKGNALVKAGWTVLRFTWHDLTNRPDYVLAEIQAALRAARATA